MTERLLYSRTLWRYLGLVLMGALALPACLYGQTEIPDTPGGPIATVDCDNKCRYRQHHKTIDGTCWYLALPSCRFCSGSDLCLPKSSDAHTAFSCQFSKSDGNIVYRSESCSPICPWRAGIAVEAEPFTGETLIGTIDLNDCKL